MMELPGRARGRPPGCLTADLVWWSPHCFCRESLLPLEILAALVHDARRASFKAGTAASARGCGVAPQTAPEYRQRDASSAGSSLHACSYLGGAGAGPRLLVFHLTCRLEMRLRAVSPCPARRAGREQRPVLRWHFDDLTQEDTGFSSQQESREGGREGGERDSDTQRRRQRQTHRQ